MVGRIKRTVLCGFIDGDGDVVLLKGDCEGETSDASAYNGDVEGFRGCHIDLVACIASLFG